VSVRLKPGERLIDGTLTKRIACESCAGMCAEVENVPTNEGPKSLCWICRHAVVRHGVPVARAWDTDCVHGEDGELLKVVYDEERFCMCSKAGIYPPEAVEKRRLFLEAHALRHEQPSSVFRAA
jgi:hypothetical protein